MGRKSRARAAAPGKAPAPAGPGPARELENAGLASIGVLLPDGATGTGYLRQWYLPRQQAQDIADLVRRRHGPPMEVIVSLDEAQAAVDTMMVVTGDDPYAQEGDTPPG